MGEGEELTREEERKQAQEELGLPEKVISRTGAGWAKALGLLIIVLLVLLSVWLG